MSHRMLRWFTWTHLSDSELQAVSRACADLAAVLDHIPDGPEKSAGLRKLLEAKDCFVRAVIEGRDQV